MPQLPHTDGSQLTCKETISCQSFDPFATDSVRSVDKDEHPIAFRSHLQFVLAAAAIEKKMKTNKHYSIQRTAGDRGRLFANVPSICLFLFSRAKCFYANTANVVASKIQLRKKVKQSIRSRCPKNLNVDEEWRRKRARERERGTAAH